MLKFEFIIFMCQEISLDIFKFFQPFKNGQNFLSLWVVQKISQCTEFAPRAVICQPLRYSYVSLYVYTTDFAILEF